MYSSRRRSSSSSRSLCPPSLKCVELQVLCSKESAPWRVHRGAPRSLVPGHSAILTNLPPQLYHNLDHNIYHKLQTADSTSTPTMNSAIPTHLPDQQVLLRGDLHPRPGTHLDTDISPPPPPQPPSGAWPATAPPPGTSPPLPAWSRCP